MCSRSCPIVGVATPGGGSNTSAPPICIRALSSACSSSRNVASSAVSWSLVGNVTPLSLDLDPESADRGRQALVVADQQTQFDRLAIAEAVADGVPGRVGECALGEQLVADLQQRSLALRQAAHRRTISHGGD